MAASAPLLGLQRFTSAMTAMPGCASAAAASRAAGRRAARGLDLVERGLRLAAGEVLAHADEDVVEHAHRSGPSLLWLTGGRVRAWSGPHRVGSSPRSSASHVAAPGRVWAGSGSGRGEVGAS